MTPVPPHLFPLPPSPPGRPAPSTAIAPTSRRIPRSPSARRAKVAPASARSLDLLRVPRHPNPARYAELRPVRRGRPPKRFPPGAHALPGVDADMERVGLVLARAVFETLGGVRPLQQLVRAVDEHVYRKLEQLLKLLRRVARRVPGGLEGLYARPRMVRMRLASPAEGVVEASIVVVDARRPRCVCMRLEWGRGGWMVTCFEVG